MALINKKQITERETVSYKLDCATVELVKFYSEFIGSPQEHVVNQSLLFVFRKDKEFSEWLEKNKPDLAKGPMNGNEKRHRQSRSRVPNSSKAS